MKEDLQVGIDVRASQTDIETLESSQSRLVRLVSGVRESLQIAIQPSQLMADIVTGELQNPQRGHLLNSIDLQTAQFRKALQVHIVRIAIDAQHTDQFGAGEQNVVGRV